MNILGIIPARYGSSRLEGKPLALIEGKTMIERVYLRAKMSLNQVVVATDDGRIVEACKSFDAPVVLTSTAHNSGTNRCLEAYETYIKGLNQPIDIVVNIQGDEPLLEPKMLDELCACFDEKNVEMATLATAVTNTQELLGDSNVFLVKDQHQDALYFSRSPLPHVRGAAPTDWLKHHAYFRHLGLYAFRPSALSEFANMPASSLENAEALEQLRWLQAGKKIRVALTQHQGISVDTAEDLEIVRKLVREQEGNA